MKKFGSSGFNGALAHGARQHLPHDGFTLLELLVTIAVVAILAALLLPALVNAKHEARRVECLSRQKQWAMALLQYVDDNEGAIPREGYHYGGSVYWNNWVQVQSANSKDVWYNALDRYVGVKPASDYFLPPNRMSFYERDSLFHCPAAKFPKSTSTPAYQIVLFSMAMNSQLIESPNYATVQLSRIKDSSRTPLFLDNLLDGETPVSPFQEKSYLGQPSSFAPRFAGRRHRRSGNITFADGHAKTFRGEQVVEMSGPNRGWAITPPREIVWQLEE